MSELAELREVLGAARVHVKSLRNFLRDTVPMLADLERRLADLEAQDAEPKEAERNGGTSKDASRDRIPV